ncbi:g5438 [Coccomyxa viridis]|uniref:G5438 protein n=1 Tax=Coccomyxa viridis TaxID=1274662 RepID=A0ABP1FVL8_9CHLO
MSSRDDVDLSDWETIEPTQPYTASAAPSRQHLASSTSALLHHKGARRALASRPQQAAGYAGAPQRSPRIWIAGILALSAFWCFVSLLAISRLEKRLPSEMQEQLEFHTSFSGLWPKAQGAAAGLNATNATMHHLPFAEASLSHKHRKKVGAAGQPDGSEALEDSDAGSSSSADEEDQYQQEPPASAYSRDEGEGGVTWSLLEPALSTLKHALAAEQSQRGLMRGLKSVRREPKVSR